MASPQHLDNEFSDRFFADVFQLYPQASRPYRCTDISDIHYCQLGVLRCLSSSTTGQEFLQFHADQGIATGHFFRMNLRNHQMSCLGMANPEDRGTYTYLTNDNTLPVYQIVLLYKQAPWGDSLARLKEVWGGIYS